MSLSTGITAAALSTLLYAIAHENTPLIWVAKPLASCGFLLSAFQAQSTFNTPYGRTILLGLVLGWIGDVLLIPSSDWTFQLGLISFLLGHVAYIAAFYQTGINPTWFLLSIPPLAVLGTVVRNGLWPTVPEDLKIPVLAYIVVISVMVAAAVGSAASARYPGSQVVGVVMFFLSDLLVAREKFVVSEFINPLVGLPLYYAAQLVLAGTLYV